MTVYDTIILVCYTACTLLAGCSLIETDSYRQRGDLYHQMHDYNYNRKLLAERNQETAQRFADAESVCRQPGTPFVSIECVHRNYEASK